MIKSIIQTKKEEYIKSLNEIKVMYDFKYIIIYYDKNNEKWNKDIMVIPSNTNTVKSYISLIADVVANYFISNTPVDILYKTDNGTFKSLGLAMVPDYNSIDIINAYVNTANINNDNDDKAIIEDIMNARVLLGLLLIYKCFISGFSDTILALSEIQRSNNSSMLRLNDIIISLDNEDLLIGINPTIDMISDRTDAIMELIIVIKEINDIYNNKRRGK